MRKRLLDWILRSFASYLEGLKPSETQRLETNLRRIRRALQRLPHDPHHEIRWARARLLSEEFLTEQELVGVSREAAKKSEA